MTSKLTRERIEQYANDPRMCNINDEIREMARMTLAAMGSEPNRNPVLAYADSYRDMAKQGVESVPIWSVITDLERNIAPLYRHAQPAVDSDFIPKNLDKALGVLGMAIPESREEFNFQTERWIQRLIDRVIRYADEFQAQPAQVVPKSISVREAISALESADAVTTIGQAYKMGWNHCRAAMLNHPSSIQPNTGAAPGAEIKHPSTNSPAIPEGYVMVPKEPTEAMMLHNSGCQHHAWDDPDCAMRQTRRLIWSHMLAAAPQEVPDGK